MNAYFLLLQEFKKNVKGVNGGSDFDQDMLEEVYQAIRQVINKTFICYTVVNLQLVK